MKWGESFEPVTQGSFGKYFGLLFLCLRAFPFGLLETAIYIFH